MQGLALSQVHVPAQKLFKLQRETGPAPRRGRLGCEGDQDVDVAVGAEVVPKHAAEHGELDDFVTPAQLSELDVVHLDALTDPHPVASGSEDSEAAISAN